MGWGWERGGGSLKEKGYKGGGVRMLFYFAGPRTTRPYKLAHGWYCLSGSENEAAQGLWKKLITLRRHMNSNSDSAAHLSNMSFSISEDSVFLENGSPRGKV